MPSLRQRVSTYIRQLSFIGDSNNSREGTRFEGTFSPRRLANNQSFVIRYLEGEINRLAPNQPEHCQVKHGKEPVDLPDLPLAEYQTGAETIVSACTGPDDGLTTVKRPKSTLSPGPESDIDFIDTAQEDPNERKSAITRVPGIYYPTRPPTATTTTTTDRNANKNVTTNGIRTSSIKSNAKSTEKTANASTSDTKRTNSLLKRKESENDASTKTIQDNLNENVKENVSPNEHAKSSTSSPPSLEEIAGVSDWKQKSDDAAGISVSLYEKSLITKRRAGSPIADCYGLIARQNAWLMALADGVNWGEPARLAARSAVQGAFVYLDKALFSSNASAKSTRAVFISLIRSFWSAHECILATGGALTTLTVAVILPLANQPNKFVVCCCNVGDSLAYVCSHKYGVRELTIGSHDINMMRDMRDAMGALGPVKDNEPELENLTLSMTIVEPGDFVFLTSDGISDNFDPIVSKFAEQIKESEFAKLQKDHPNWAKYYENHLTATSNSPPLSATANASTNGQSSAAKFKNFAAKSRKELSARIRHQPRRQEMNVVMPMQAESQPPQLLRSHTTLGSARLDHRADLELNVPLLSKALKPIITGYQRHQLTLLRIEELLLFGEAGQFEPCVSADDLCEWLFRYCHMITQDKRGMLEQKDLYYKSVPMTSQAAGAKPQRKYIELSRLQQKAMRQQIVANATFRQLPGKLDHASVVAVKIQSSSNDDNVQPQTTQKQYTETDF